MALHMGFVVQNITSLILFNNIVEVLKYVIKTIVSCRTTDRGAPILISAITPILTQIAGLGIGGIGPILLSYLFIGTKYSVKHKCYLLVYCTRVIL